LVLHFNNLKAVFHGPWFLSCVDAMEAKRSETKYAPEMKANTGCANIGDGVGGRRDIKK
jgi:hypothetical protein